MVERYVERNPLRAQIVSRGEDWAWSSLRCSLGLAMPPSWVDPSWLERPAAWLNIVNAVQPAAELTAIRLSVTHGKPLGSETWRRQITGVLGSEQDARE